MDCAVSGAGKQPIVSHGQSEHATFDGVIHHDLARGGLERKHEAIAPGKERVAREHQRAEFFAFLKPLDARAIERGLFLVDNCKTRGCLGEVGVELFELLRLVSGGLLEFANGRDGFHQRGRFLVQRGHGGVGLEICRAVDSENSLSRCNVRGIGREHHVDGWIPRKPVATTSTTFDIECDFGISALIGHTRKQFIAIDHRPRAANLAARVEKALVLARALVELRGHTATRRHEQRIGRGHQVSLRRHATVQQPPRLVAGGVVHPNLLAGLGVHRRNVNPLVREDAGGGIKNAVFNQNTRANRPQRNHPASADDALPAGAGTIFPDERSLGGVHTINIAIVRTKINPPTINHRRKPHGTLGGKAPFQFACARVQRVNVIVHVVSKNQSGAGDDRVIGAIRVHALLLLDRQRPSRTRNVPRLKRPLRENFRGHFCGAHGRALSIVAISWPVFSIESGGNRK